MLENLSDKQILAVAVVSHVYYHHDPMSLIASSETEQGIARLKFWMDTHSGRVTSTPTNDQVNTLLKAPRVELPHVEVPIRSFAKSNDMTMPAGRRGFVHSVLTHLITAQWSSEVELDKIGLTTEDCNNIRSKLFTPKVTPRGTECAKQVLTNVIIPALVEDMPAGSKIH